MTENKNKTDTKKGLKIAAIISIVFFGFIILVSRPPSPCKCLEIKKNVDEDYAWARTGEHWDVRKPWRKCYKAYEAKAIKEWKQRYPNYTRAQYYYAWGAYENTGMVELYLKRTCNTNKKEKR
tara:strand:- start:92 stop:460 length:369 start_codon:yes stop_codon:yes gene_type:complete